MRVQLPFPAIIESHGVRIPLLFGFICSTAIGLTFQIAAAAEDGFTIVEADQIQAFLRDNFANGNAGMVIGLLDKDGGRAFAAGKLDNGTDQEVNGDTIFEIGSTTKVFTSLLALDMDRRGEIKLDDPVAKYLPNRVKIPSYDGRQISFRHLAAQDSGLPWNPEDLDQILQQTPKESSLRKFKNACDAYTAEDLYTFLAKYELTSAPGTKFQYSNVGMALLGHALALKAGESYESLVVERICRPLKMDSTCITLTTEQKTRLARGHFDDGTLGENVSFQVMASAGSLLSTTNDLLKFLSANLSFTQTELGQPMQEMQVIRHSGEPRFGNTAMPWFDDAVYQPPGMELLAHGGGGFGYLAFMGFDKRKRRGVVILSNQMAVNPSGVGWTILQGMPLTPENIRYIVREIVGVGVALDADKKTGLLRITTVYPKSPAAQAGLSAGLLIQKINGISVEGKEVRECVAMLGGPPGGAVELEISDPDGKETRTVEVTRQKFITSSR
jgi:D-alanyl-D-alanine-carboxypeptidase/D-alanyl-D-alanine-endopeptidase